MKRRHNHTVMSGRVVTFAEDFDNQEARFPNTPDATGFYKITSSRDGVNVHHCWVTSPAQLDELKEAMDLAVKEHIYLQRSDGRPDDGDSGEVREAS